MSRRLLFGIWIMIVSVVSCKEDPIGHRRADSFPPELKEHKEMIAYLASMGTVANPDENYHLNGVIASSLKQQIAVEKDPSKRLSKTALYGRQLLRAGKADEAIIIYENILNQLGSRDKVMTEQTKLLNELLAIAYLRKGELDNCVANHNDASCIVPLSSDALHKLKLGSEKALDIYEEIVRVFPDDKNAQYLKMVAEMTLGGKNMLSEMPTSKSLEKWKNKATGLGIDKGDIAGGTIVDDFNNDGYLDIVASSYRYGDQLTYYENDGKGSFVDKTVSANLKGITGGLNLNHMDFNNDGNLDIFVMRGGWLGKGGLQPNSLLQGHGDGTFTDVTRSAGLFSLHPTQTSVWADFDLDGNIDVFIGNESGALDYGGQGGAVAGAEVHKCELYMNNGDGTFTNRAPEVGMDLQFFVKGVTAGDINNDHYPDIYLSLVNGPNILIVNTTARGGALQFSQSSSKVQVGSPLMSFPTWIWDYNNDGLEDIYVGAYDVRKLTQTPADYMDDLAGETSDILPPALYRNNGDGTFTDVAKDMDLHKSMFAMGCNFGDLNADGDLDFYIGTGAPDLSSIVPNRMFLNKGSSFEEVSFNGFAHIQKGHGIGWGDVDADGDEDIYAVMGGAFEGDVAQNVLFQNPSEGHSHVTLRLRGTQSNKAAIGARVRIRVSDGSTEKAIYRTVGGGSSFGANSLQLEVGLGAYTTIQDVAVWWPVAGSQWQSLGPVPINKVVQIEEGSATPFSIVELQSFDFKSGSHSHEHHH